MTPKEIMQKWIDALRSGSYTQMRGSLRKGDCFCALGVLCDIYAKEGIGEWIGDMFNTKGSDKPPTRNYLPRKIGDELVEYELTIRPVKPLTLLLPLFPSGSPSQLLFN